MENKLAPGKPGQPEKTERNELIYADWKNGMTYFEMRLKYKISEHSIRRILLRYWEKFGRDRLSVTK